MGYLHKDLACGKWNKLSLAEQFANIGAEVGRAAKWQNKDPKIFEGAVLRALELFDLTLEDKRWKGRLYEIARLRELFLCAVENDKQYNTSLKDLERYFMPFMLCIRK
ncbi:MAG: hypothetical protein PHI53_01300 [Candidatus Pacebacteria bacterium]|nr:hypothetical protein [Candidatus Paceibacterota bacterium]